MRTNRLKIRLRLELGTRIKMSLFFVHFLALILNFGCYFNNSETFVIRIKGSDTMFILTSKLAQEFMKQHAGISVFVEGGGTKIGIDGLLNGSIDICSASRLLKPDEIKIMADVFQTIGVSTLVAKDALSIYVNKDNPIKNFSLEDLKDIFTCSKTKWSDFGGEDEMIKIYTRSPNSGTYLYFKEHVLQNENYCSDAIVRASTPEIAESVAEDKYAIGYGGIGYRESIYHASISNIAPTEENVRNNTYPISRYLFFVTRDNPKGVIKQFIDWVLSYEGQNVVEQVGYISLWNK